MGWVGDVPQPDGVVGAAGGEDAAVGAKGDGVDRYKIQNGPGNAPQPGGMIPASAREHRAVRTEGDRRYNRRMAAYRPADEKCRIGILHIPEPDRVVIVAGREHAAVRTER